MRRDNLILSSELVDRIGSVAQLRLLQAGEVPYEPSQPNVSLFVSSRFAGSTTPSGHGPHLSSATLLMEARRDCLIVLRATSTRNM